MLEHIEIKCVRNLAALELSFAGGATALFGANGSGKTSFLEAVHLLGVGRSFRTHQSKPVIQHDAASCRVVGRMNRAGRPFVMGIEKHRDGQVRARVDGEPIPSLSELAQQLPLVLLDTDGLTLLTGPPEGRRRLLDGTLFHVEHAFLGLWKRYAHSLRQRNSGLRHGILASDKAWRQELADTGERLTQVRLSVVERYAEKLKQLAIAISPDLAEVEMAFRAGWDRRESLHAALEKSAQSDAAQGFTQVGPHRADLRFSAGGRGAAAEVLSRGQMKLLLVALKLAQGQIIEETCSVQPLYLIDDLPAELDESHCASVCAQLRGGRQVIMTAVDRASLERAWGDEPMNLFHVEQGRVWPSE